MRIGYGRVSTRDQRPEAQRDALAAAGCDRIFLDVVSGKLARRPELDKALLSANRAGDQLVVTKLDRLGRSLEHLIELSKHLEAAGVDLVVLDQDIDTSTAIGRMFFQILGAVAEFEHTLMSERTMDGLAASRARGRTGGQKPKLGPRQVKLAQQMYDETGADGKRRYTVAQIAAEFGVTRPTIYRHLSKPVDIGPPDTRRAPRHQRYRPDQHGDGYLRAPLRSLRFRPLTLPSAPVAPHARRPPPPTRQALPHPDQAHQPSTEPDASADLDNDHHDHHVHRHEDHDTPLHPP